MMAHCHDARISTGLPSHPKTKKLIRRLGPAAGWHLVCMFLWVAANRSDGDLSGMAAEDIELAADWSGDGGAFVTGMADVGFLDGEEGARSIHDWADHNPWAAGASARSEKSRWAALRKHHGQADAVRMMPEYAERLGVAGRGQGLDNPDPANGMRESVPNAASGMPVADLGSAPSPLPLPSPSPSPPEEQEADASLSVGEKPPADVASIAGKADNCPHADIIATYHELLPANPRIKVWDGARQKALRTRWREDPKRQSLEYWERFLRHVSASPFLTGKVDGSNGRPFLPGLEWLVKSSNFAKIIEGRYHDRQTA